MFGRKKEEDDVTTDSPIHESGYMFQEGERLIVGVKAAAPSGDGWLLETNKVMLFKHNTEGIQLRVALKSIEEMTHKKGTIKIAWREYTKPYKFTVKLRQKMEGVDQWMKNTEKFIRSNMTGYVVLEGDEESRVRKFRTELFEDAIKQQTEQRDALKKQLDYLRGSDYVKYKEATLQAYQFEDMNDEISRLEKQLKQVKTMMFTRANSVPQDIPNEYVWNDTWYEKERKVYFTNSEVVQVFFGKGKFTDYQIEKKATDYAYMIPEKHIVFVYGYPSVRRNEEKGIRMLMLPTMIDEMLNSDIVTSRIEPDQLKTLHPDRHEARVMYTTVSKKEHGGGRYTEAERVLGKENNILFLHDDILFPNTDSCDCEFCSAPRKKELGTIYPALFSNYHRKIDELNDFEYVAPGKPVPESK